MTIVLIASAIGVALVIGTAMALPCPACKRRRERMRAAVLEWRRAKNARDL